MAANPDPTQRAVVKFKTPPSGSCWTPAALAELERLIEVRIPETSSTSGTCVSLDANNLATLDAEGCLLVPKAAIYSDEKTWSIGTGADVVFDGWDASIDPTAAFINVIMRPGSDRGNEFVTASGSPDTKKKVMPVWFYKEITASKVVIGVQGATQDISLTLQILVLPNANQQV